MSDTCPSCGVPYVDHLELISTCAWARQLESTLASQHGGEPITLLHELDEARARVESLRAQVAALTGNGVSIHKAVARERAAIVAHLRARRPAPSYGGAYVDPNEAMRQALQEAADAIERGDHCDEVGP